MLPECLVAGLKSLHRTTLHKMSCSQLGVFARVDSHGSDKGKGKKVQ